MREEENVTFILPKILEKMRGYIIIFWGLSLDTFLFI